MAHSSQQQQLISTTRPSHASSKWRSPEHSLSSPSLVPSPLVARRLSATPPSHFRCTGCGKTFLLPGFKVGKRPRVVCRECWRWMWNISICWSCGEVVFRKTDAVGFGWCWWHWSCFSCLVCSVSVLRSEKLTRIDGKVPVAASRLLRFQQGAVRKRHHSHRATSMRPLYRLIRLNHEARAACGCAERGRSSASEGESRY